MTDNSIFQWHPSARLFAGALEIMRPKVLQSLGFQAISATDTPKALARLGASLGSGDGFCLNEGNLPNECSVAKGHFLTLTGGSTGAPKVIWRSQASWTASFAINRDLFGLTSHDRFAVFGQLSHSLALYGVLEGLHLGLDVHALAGLSPSAQRSALKVHQATILYATPTQLRLLATGRTNPLPHVRLILCGGGQIDHSTAQNIANLCPKAELRIFYGAAETSFITLSEPTTPPGSVGKAYPGVTFEVREPDGEIWVKSPYLFEGYASSNDGAERDNNGFISIGELGQMAPDGSLTIKGRKTRIVTIADQNVHLENVERVIGVLVGVTACAVLAQPDTRRGHRLVAIIEGLQDAQRAQHIKEHCRHELSAHVTPKTVLFIDALPLLPSGKTDLVALTHWLEQQT